jgi:hypothetical protein
MAISHVKKIIFIHIAKTGGTSIVRTPDYRFIVDGHKSVMHYKEKHTDIFQEYFKICLVRNPWDRFVSMYAYVNTKESYYHTTDKPHPDYEKIKGMSFDTVLDLLVQGELDSSQFGWLPQSPQVKNEQSNIQVDHIFKTEDMSINREFLKFFPTVQHLNKSIRRSANYRDYYSDSSRKKLADHYAEDIANFGYTF